MKTEKINKATEFVLRCINEVGADGYQTWEDDSGDVPDGITPDDVTVYGNSILLQFGSETFVAKFTKIRKP